MVNQGRRNCLTTLARVPLIVATGGGLLSFLEGCSKPTKEVDVNIGRQDDEAVISGRVLIGRIRNNRVEYSPVRGINVVLRNSSGEDVDVETTFSDGGYSFVNLAAQRYQVLAALSWYVTNPQKSWDELSVQAQRLVTVNAPDLQLLEKPVLEGIAYNQNRTTPLANTGIVLFGSEWEAAPEQLTSTVTSSSGEFAFPRYVSGVQIPDPRYFEIRTEGGTPLLFTDNNSERSVIIPNSKQYNIVEKNVYLSS